MNGLSAEHTFALDEVDSFTLVIEGRSSARYGVRSLRGPEGVLVRDAYDATVPETDRRLLGPSGGPRTSPNPALDAAGRAALLVPNASGIDAVPGTYTYRVGASDLVGRAVDDIVRVAVCVRSDALNTGSLALQVHGEEGALGSEALAEARRIFRTVSIELEEPITHPLTAFSGRTRDLDSLFAQGRGDGLRVFLVDDLDGSLAGTSGGLPGVPHFAVRASTGIVLNRSALPDPVALGRALAHEGAHWLGLFHTSEGGALADPIDDTPLGAGEEDNLMFPSTLGGTVLTAEQGRILRRHPEVRNTNAR